MMTTLAETAISQVKKNGIFVLPGIGRLVRVDQRHGWGETRPRVRRSRSRPRKL